VRVPRSPPINPPQVAEHQNADRQEHDVERGEQTRATRASPNARRREIGGADTGDRHRRDERQDQHREDRFARSRRLGDDPEEAPHRRESDDPQHERGDQQERARDREVEQHHDEQEHGDHEREQLDRHGEGLPEVDRGLVDRREQQPFEGAVLRLRLVRAAGRHDGREQQRHPQETGRDPFEDVPPRAEREPERHEDGRREREQRPDRVSSAHLDQEILARDHACLAREGHEPVSTEPSRIVTTRAARPGATP
jgi:hypothetical protein